MLGWLKKSSVWEWNDKRRAENILRDIGKHSLQNEKKLNARLIKAVGDNMPETVKALIKAGASPDAQIYYGYGSSNYSYPVITRAAASDQPHMVKVLVEAGANINKADTLDGHTPLIEAVRKGNAAATRLLLDLGADIDIHTSIHSDENKGSITTVAAIDIAERHAFAGIKKMLEDEPARRRQAQAEAAAAKAITDAEAAAEVARTQLIETVQSQAVAAKDPSVTQTGQDIEISKPLQIKRRKGLFR